MRLKAVELENWFCYREPITLTFPTPKPGRPLFVVRGRNGHGKTSLLRGISTALLGEDALEVVKGEFPRRQSESDHDWFSRFLFEALNYEERRGRNPSMRLSVAWKENGSEVRITRRFNFTRRPDAATMDAEQVVSLFIDDQPQVLDSENGEDDVAAFVRSRVVGSVAKFFFFDGERIGEISRRDQSEAMRDGLDDLLGMSLVSRLREDIERESRDYLRQLTEGSGTNAKIREAQDELDQLEITMLGDETNRSKAHREAEDLRAQVSALQEELGSGISRGGGGSRIDAAERIRFLEAEQSRLQMELMRTLSEPSILFGLDDFEAGRVRMAAELDRREVDQASAEAMRRRERLVEGMFGPGAPQPDPPLTHGQEAYLSGRLSDVAAEVLGIRAEVSVRADAGLRRLSDAELRTVLGHLEEIRAATNQGQRTATAVADLENAVRDLNQAQEDLRRDSPGRRDATERLRELSEQLGKRQLEAEQLEGDIRASMEKRAEVSRRIALLQGELPPSELKSTVGRLNDLQTLLNDFQNHIRQTRVKELERAIERMLKELAHKGSGLVDRVRIDPLNFRLSLIDRDGNERERPSAGEDELLALSMVWALGQVSRRTLPLIIDTPLGRLDLEHRSNVLTKFYAKAAEQIVVLATDSEITDEGLASASLKAIMCGYSDVVFDESAGTTEVIDRA